MLVWKQDEIKSKRFNALIRPSTAEALAKIAFAKKTSVNDIINTLAEDYVITNTAALQKYDEIAKILNWEKENNK